MAIKVQSVVSTGHATRSVIHKVTRLTVFNFARIADTVLVPRSRAFLTSLYACRSGVVGIHDMGVDDVGSGFRTGLFAITCDRVVDCSICAFSALVSISHEVPLTILAVTEGTRQTSSPIHRPVPISRTGFTYHDLCLANSFF